MYCSVDLPSVLRNNNINIIYCKSQPKEVVDVQLDISLI
jgi:hypothetical protein